MKRVLAVIMTLTMLLGMVTPVMADETPVVVEVTDVETVTGTEVETLPENDADAPSGEEEAVLSDEEPDAQPEEETAASDEDADAQPEEETAASDEDADAQSEEETVAPDEDADAQPEEETVAPDGDADAQPEEETVAPDGDADAQPGEAEEASSENSEEAPVLFAMQFAAAGECTHPNAVSIEGSEEHFAYIKSNPGLFDVDLTGYDKMPVLSNYKYLNNEEHSVSGTALLGTYCPDCGCYQDVRLEYVTKVQDHKIGDYVWSFYDTCVYGACDLVTCEYCGSEYKHITSDEEKLTDHEPTRTPVEACWWRGYQLDCVFCGIYGYTVVEETYDEPHHLPALSELRSTTATCTETGINTYFCTECEVEYTVEAEALGHNYVNGVCVRCGAETSMDICAHENTVSIEGSEEHFAMIAGHPDLFDIDLSDYDEMPVPSNYTFTDNETHTVSGEVLLGTYCPDCGMYQNVRIETVTRTEEHDCTETDRWTIPVCWYPGVDIYYCKYCDHDYEVEYAPATPHTYVNGICTGCGAEEPGEVTCTHENAVSIAGDMKQYGIVASHYSIFGIELPDEPEYTYEYLDDESHSVSGEILMGTYCPDCGRYQNVHVEEATLTVAHVLSEDYAEIRWEPTCIEPGCKAYTCPDCNATISVDIPKLTDHEPALTPVENCWWKGYEANCDQCEAYGVIIVEEEYDEPHHLASCSTMLSNTATCTESGIATYYCYECDVEYTMDSDPLGHSYVNGVCSRCGDETSVEDCAHENTISIEGLQEHFAVIAANPEVFDIDLSDYDEMPVPSNYQYLDNERHTVSGEALLGTYCPDCGLYQDVRIATVTKTEAHQGSSATGWIPATCVYDGHDEYVCDLCWNAYEVRYKEDPKLTDHEPERTEILTCYQKGYELNCDICGVYNYVVIEEEYDEPHHVNPELIYTVPADCKVIGVEHYYCPDCDIEYDVDLPTLGHNYVNGVCTRCAEENPEVQDCEHKNAVSIEGSEEHFAVIAANPALFDIDLSDYDEIPVASDYVYLDNERHTVSGEALLGTYCPDCGIYQDVRIAYVTEAREHVATEDGLYESQPATCMNGGADDYICPFCDTLFTVATDPQLTDHEPVRTPTETCRWNGYDVHCDVCGIYGVTEVAERYDEPHHLASCSELVGTTATCTEAGVNTWYCTSCDVEYTEETEALGHSYVDGVCERCGINGKVTALVPDFTSVVLGVGQKKTLGYETVPEGAATPGSITYSSSDTTVATVGKTSGQITAKAAGTAAITIAVNNGVKTTVKVTVKPAPTAIKLNKTAVTIGEGDDVQLTYTLGPSNAASTITFTSSNKDAATVDKNGCVTAVSAGTATITAKTHNGLTATCKVTVIKAPEGITVTPEEATIAVGKTVKLAAELIGEDVGGSYTFSTDSACVSVNKTSGLVTATAPGVATVTVETYNGKTAEAVITVIAAPDTLTLDRTSMKMGVKQTYQLEPQVSYKGSDDCMTTLSYTSSDSTIVSVSKTGLLTAKSTGIATITVKTDNGLSATLSVAVKIVPTSIKMNQSVVTVGVCDEVQLKYTLGPSGAIAGMTYSSGNTDIAVVDENGIVTALKEGSATITAKTHNGLTATCTVQVIEGAEGITVTPEEKTIAVAQTVKLSAALVGENTTGSYTFHTDSECVTVNETTGLVTAVAPGVATVIAESYNGKTAEAVITVMPAPDSVKLAKTSVSMGLKQTMQLEPQVSYQGTDNYMTTLTYTSSNSDVVAVNSSGVIGAKAVGTATITVKAHNGVKATLKVTVKAVPTAIKMTSSTVKVAKGDTVQLKYTLTPSDSATGVTYTSSNPSVVSVDANGRVTGLAAGSVTITARTHNGLKAGCTVTVISEPEGITIKPETGSVSVGQTLKLSAALVGDNVTGSYTFSTESDLITVNATTGLVTALKPGEAIVTVESYNKLTAQAVITVVPEPDAVELGSTSVSMGLGQTIQLNPVATCNEGTIECTATYTYSSSNSAVVAVSSSGKIGAKAIGTATITVKAHNGVKATLKVTVKPAPTAIKLSKTSVSLTAGSSVQLKYTLTESGSATKVTYTSSNPSVATVDAKGNVTAVSAGTATIAAKTHNGLKAGCKVTVTGSVNQPR